jgi:hypothetical protein
LFICSEEIPKVGNNIQRQLTKLNIVMIKLIYYGMNLCGAVYIIRNNYNII